jgi:hypothetical protein
MRIALLNARKVHGNDGGGGGAIVLSTLDVVGGVFANPSRSQSRLVAAELMLLMSLVSKSMSLGSGSGCVSYRGTQVDDATRLIWQQTRVELRVRLQPRVNCLRCSCA